MSYEEIILQSFHDFFVSLQAPRNEAENFISCHSVDVVTTGVAGMNLRSASWYSSNDPPKFPIVLRILYEWSTLKFEAFFGDIFARIKLQASINFLWSKFLFVVITLQYQTEKKQNFLVLQVLVRQNYATLSKGYIKLKHFITLASFTTTAFQHNFHV